METTYRALSHSFLRSAACLMGWILLATPALAQQPGGSPSKTFVELHGALGTRANRVVDQDGNPVVVRGMSLFWSQWMPQYYNEDCLKWLRDDWHINVVRAAMGVSQDGYLGHPDVERARIKTVVQVAIDLGIYVIIDWHEEQAHTHLAQSQAFFEDMAKTYGRYPNVIFETWNEPTRTTWDANIKPYHEAVIPRIRQYTKNLIVCGTATWSQDVDKASLNPLKFDNIAYTLHFYASTHKQSLRDKATKALGNGIPIFVTEWGASEASGNGKLDRVETQTWLDFLEKNQISSCNWAVDDKAETSAALKPGAAGAGGWSLDILSDSGKLVRDMLRLKNPVASSPAATRSAEVAR